MNAQYETMLGNERNEQAVSIFCAFMLCLILVGCSQAPSAEDRVVALLADDAPYHLVSEELFDELGWDLPDDGAAVTIIAFAAPCGAIDPRDLESISSESL